MELVHGKFIMHNPFAKMFSTSLSVKLKLESWCWKRRKIRNRTSSAQHSWAELWFNFVCLLQGFFCWAPIDIQWPIVFALPPPPNSPPEPKRAAKNCHVFISYGQIGFRLNGKKNIEKWLTEKNRFDFLCSDDFFFAEIFYFVFTDSSVLVA